MNAVICDRCGLITMPHHYFYRKQFHGKEEQFDLCEECARKLNAFIYEDEEHMMNLGKKYKNDTEINDKYNIFDYIRK